MKLPSDDDGKAPRPADGPPGEGARAKKVVGAGRVRSKTVIGVAPPANSEGKPPRDAIAGKRTMMGVAPPTDDHAEGRNETTAPLTPAGPPSPWTLPSSTGAAQLPVHLPPPSLGAPPENLPPLPLSSTLSEPPPLHVGERADEANLPAAGPPPDFPAPSWGAPGRFPIDEEPVESPPMARLVSPVVRRVAGAGLGAVVLVAGALSARALVARRAQSDADERSTVEATPASATAAATVSASVTAAASATTDPATTTPSSAASAGAGPSASVPGSAPSPSSSGAKSGAATVPHHEAPPLKPFAPAAAKTALDALAPKLTDCKIPVGRSGRVEVTFAPDGHVTTAKALPALAGTHPGACVAAHLKQAHVPPFHGPATKYVHTFVIKQAAPRH